MQQHAYVIEGEPETGLVLAEQVAEKEFNIRKAGNPDYVTLRYGLLTIEEARKLANIAAQAPVASSEKVIAIAAGRLYGEAQNALLKLFEEPPKGVHLFLILPSVGGLLPTLKSRVQILKTQAGKQQAEIPEVAQKFMKLSREKRTAYIKKLATGKDEEDRRENRDEAIAIINGIEAAAARKGVEKYRALIADVEKLRPYLHDRSGPLRMILEHISLVLPSGLV